MPSRVEMVGRRYGRLVVVADRNESGSLLGTPAYRLVDVVCDCGTAKRISGRSLRRGHAISCGCAQREVATKHGLSAKRIYSVWNAMRQRCADKSNPVYGGRGISVCAEWLEGPKSFIAWAESNGYAPGLEIDRIDSNGDYCPNNCRFITKKKNANNTRRNLIVSVNGINMTLADACECSNVPYDVAIQRIKKLGWSVEAALITPVRETKRRAA